MQKIDKKDYAMACMQLNVILGNLDEEEREKIPRNILNEINKYKSNKYIYKYDFSKTLLEQEMLSLTKELLYYIYSKYLVIKETNDKTFMKNNYCKELSQQYNMKNTEYNIFKSNKTLKTLNEEKEKNLPIKTKEEKLWQKIVRYIKKFFNIEK